MNYNYMQNEDDTIQNPAETPGEEPIQNPVDEPEEEPVQADG